MFRTRSFVRLLVFVGVMMFVADSSDGQIVIRERVKVDASQATAHLPAQNIEFSTCSAGAVHGWYSRGDGYVSFGFDSVSNWFQASRFDIYALFLSIEVAGGSVYHQQIPILDVYSGTGCSVCYNYVLGGAYLLGEVSTGDAVTAYVTAYHQDGSTVIPHECSGEVNPNPAFPETSYWITDIDYYNNDSDNGGLFQINFHLGPPASLAVVAEPDSLNLGDVSVLSVEGRDEEDATVPLPPDVTLDLTLDQGGGTIGFLRWNGVEAVVLGGVPASDVDAGLVEVVASEPQVPTLTPPGETSALRVQEEKGLVEEGQPPVNSMGGETLLTVTAALADDPSVTGSVTVVVMTTSPSLELTFALNGSPIDPATYLPSKDDIIEVTARLVGGPPDATGDVTFELAQADDFEFDGTGGSGPVSVPLQNGEATISIKSLTWWGVATVQADYDLDGVPLMVDQQIPVDSDGDLIADAWEDANGGRSLGGNPDDRDWNEETSAGNANDGDSFSKLAEYQGVLRGGAHVGLLPTEKEVFLDIRGASAGAFVVTELESQLGLKVYEVEGWLE